MDILNKMVIKHISHKYNLDSEYLDTDNGDYGITFNRIIASMPSKGGAIMASDKDYKFNTKVVSNKPICVSGLGESDFLGTKWITGFYTDSSIEVFEFLENSTFMFDGIHFYNTQQTPTAGNAIRAKGKQDGTVNKDNAINRARVSNCSFRGFYDNLYFDGACQWLMFNVLNFDYLRYGLYIENKNNQDWGDSRIIGCDFYSYREQNGGTLSKSHIYVKGSGGLKISSTKFNYSAEYCILGEINAQTVIILVANCSFENYTKGAIKLSKVGGAIFRHVNISGCEFDSYKPNTTDIDITGGILDISIIGNTFSSESPSNTAINLNSVDNVRLLNTYRGYTNALNMFNSTNVKEAVLQDPIATNINK